MESKLAYVSAVISLSIGAIFDVLVIIGFFGIIPYGWWAWMILSAFIGCVLGVGSIIIYSRLPQEKK